MIITVKVSVPEAGCLGLLSTVCRFLPYQRCRVFDIDIKDYIPCPACMEARKAKEEKP